MREKIDEFWNEMFEENDDVENAMQIGAILLDAACVVGAFSLTRGAIKRYFEPKGFLQKCGAFGLSCAVAGLADRNFTKVIFDTNERRHENGRDTNAGEAGDDNIIDAGDAFSEE